METQRWTRLNNQSRLFDLGEVLRRTNLRKELRLYLAYELRWLLGKELLPPMAH